ncbi:MAG: sn-glycerol-1-phosphate dehydrogenase [Clostridiales bacterium]|jgi:glycerol-1-phosphate dehydrogenase [NAD(P)+]|nr:sn-glycerol-1-phosphate dehydrogenase [Clostridiales bacterium]
MNSSENFADLALSELLREEGFACSCGKHHKTDVKDIIIGSGVLDQIPEQVRKHGGSKPFLLADRNTFHAAGEKVVSVLEASNIPYSCYIYPQEDLEPNELAVGQAAMNFDVTCDIIIGIGSGTINDIGKMLAMISGRKYMIVGTAPSMDGYASNTSSMISAGIKVSLPSACASVIIADLDIISRAPMKMLQAGLGDMLAKYISICEWRISHLITGEYYCEQIASLVRRSLKRCIESAKGLAVRDPEAVKNVLDGLILSGMAMGFAGISRPASGIEHYFSHVWDMRALEFNTNNDLHGIQVGIGTVLALKIYDQITSIKPSREKALWHAEQFNLEEYNSFLRQFLGSSAENLILLEQKEGKYDKDKHKQRLETILQHWDDILRIIKEELPGQKEAVDLLNEVGAPIDPSELGFSSDLVINTLHAAKDIRDKYSISRLLWDLGELDMASEILA